MYYQTAEETEELRQKLLKLRLESITHSQCQAPNLSSYSKYLYDYFSHFRRKVV